MSNMAEHMLFHSHSKEQELVEVEFSQYECTQCFHISKQCLIDVCPHCGEAMVERQVRPSEMLDSHECHSSMHVSITDGTVFTDDSKLA